jgi:spermidine synthase
MESSRRISILIGITALGISSVITQVTLTRELLTVFHGNELVIGYSMAVWLLLTGMGALAGRRRPTGIERLIVLLIPVALLPVGHVLALRYGRELFAVRGASVDLRVLFVSLPLLLLPYCLVSGYLLPAACGMLAAEESAADIGRVYFADTIGDILGGLLFSFVLVHVTTTLGALYVPAVLCLGAAGWLGTRPRRYRRWLPVVAAGMVVVALLGWGKVDRRSIERLYAGLRVEQVEETPYGRVVVTRHHEQLTFFENGIPVASNTDVLDAEETVHFALAQLPRRPLRVLVVSGGLSGVIDEVLRYPVARVDYVELDPLIVSLSRRYGRLPRSERVHVHTGDGRVFVEKTRHTYDAVVVDVPPPSTMQLNRFYTAEFFAAVERVLAPGGVVSFSLPGPDNYLTRELARLYGVVAATARTVFSHVEVFPASKAVFVVANRRPERDIGSLLGERGIETHYVNAHYLRGVLTPERVSEVARAVAGGEAVNRDLRPVAFLYQVRYWLSVRAANVAWMPVVFVIAALVLLVRYGPVQGALWTTGFVSISLELCIVLMYQAFAGSVYHRYGLIVALFMIGLAVGSYGATGCIARMGAGGESMRRVLIVLVAALLGYCIVFEIVSRWTMLWRNAGVLYGCVVLAASIAGAQFPVAAAVGRGRVAERAGGLYAADFLGSGIGAFLTALVLIPALGIGTTVLVLIALTAVALARLARG